MEPTLRTALEDCCRADSFPGGFLFSRGTTNSLVAGNTLAGGLDLQRATIWMEEQAAVRRADSGELPARVCLEQLAESCTAPSMGNFSVWRVVRDAFARLWRGDGYCARPTQRAADDGDVYRHCGREASDCGVPVPGECAGVCVLSGRRDRRFPRCRCCLVCAGCAHALE